MDDYLKCLGELIAIDSTAGVAVSADAPYGKGSAEALSYALKLCASFGMRTVNRQGKVGYAEIGEGKELVGILVHLDAVPAGEGWEVPPYALTEREGKLYGRGIMDDKGPAMACIFAMKDLLEKGEKLGRRVRIIFGQSEENGDWSDFEYYCKTEELPTFGFTPDANFPAIYGEKGIANYELRMPLTESGLKSADGGTVANVVPEACRVVLADGREVTAEGKSAHASTPELGENAISVLMERLNAMGAEGKFLRFYEERIGKNLYGEKMPCALQDEQSGRLTMNAGMLKSFGEDLVLTLDIRYPVTFRAEAVDELLTAAAEPYGIEVKRTFDNAPIYTDKNGRVMQRLLSVYRKATGDFSEPMVIGGGTYARSMPNIVTFGPILPGREMTEHQRNEYMQKEDVLLMREIYRDAIEALANL